jgi:transcriptional regulator with XRE-family HTH domain
MTKPEQAPSRFSQDFAKQVRDLMDEHGITQVAVSKRLGRAQSFVSERVGGVRPVDTDTLEAIASLIPGMTMNRLMEEVMRRLGSLA